MQPVGRAVAVVFHNNFEFLQQSTLISLDRRDEVIYEKYN
jgi:hypothetical protein